MLLRRKFRWRGRNDGRNDNVLGLSAQVFLQGLYPASTSANTQTLANGTTESAPLNGYQYVLLNGIPADAPESIQIAGDQNCPVITAASKAYYNSTKFLAIQNQTQAFYNKFTPLISGDFTPSQIGFQSAYNIFDYLNVQFWTKSLRTTIKNQPPQPSIPANKSTTTNFIILIHQCSITITLLYSLL